MLYENYFLNDSFHHKLMSVITGSFFFFFFLNLHILNVTALIFWLSDMKTTFVKENSIYRFYARAAFQTLPMAFI